MGDYIFDKAFLNSFCKHGGIMTLIREIRLLPLKFKQIAIGILFLISEEVQLSSQKYWKKVTRWIHRQELIICIEEVQSSTQSKNVRYAAVSLLCLLNDEVILLHAHGMGFVQRYI